jgi:hypothetical protein
MFQSSPTRPLQLANATSVALLALALTGCLNYNYQVGVGSLFRPDIRTVYVQVSDQGTYRRNMAERLWEAVVKEIEARTPYKVVDPDRADAQLTVAIVREEKDVLVENRNDEVREGRLHMGVRVVWAGRQTTLCLPPEAIEVQAAAEFVAEVGHSIATSHQEALKRLAMQIVDLMEIDPLAAVDNPPLPTLPGQPPPAAIPYAEPVPPPPGSATPGFQLPPFQLPPP